MIKDNEDFNKLKKMVQDQIEWTKSNFENYSVKPVIIPSEDLNEMKNSFQQYLNNNSITRLPRDSRGISQKDLDKINKKEKEMENKERKYMDTETNSYTVRKEDDRKHPRFDREKIMDAVRMLIEAIGDDPNREGLLGTPDRVARMYEELFEGMSYTNDQIAEMFNTSFETSEDNEDLVTVGQIPIGSFCEHHLMPMVNMTASIGYIPVKGRVVGLSKLARIAMLAASRLQLQEKIGEDIAYIVQKVTGSPDVIVVIEGEHTCMTMRGIKARGSLTRTATLRGRFRDNVSLRQEFYSLIKA